MKFIVNRKTISLAESKKPCEEAREEALTPLDYRTVGTLEEAKKKIWYKSWLEGGENHREEGGVVVCDKKARDKQWIVEMKTLEELIDFQARHGEIRITDSSPYKEARKEIQILGAK